ncbi:hypothetical protein QUF61_07335 [Candidatus Venteria ishoeyi]|uniref:hypothetical protein n=1 Tax=Candidatus Venteria ishoeyi TaxID=1899563 RepID=UPI0025A50214|nr:hypothetical protein [Candidatus Venteria ishoeyi]MDM8546291.1 hypothetical protein [Candidatus Venteria ishoeyi]
MAQLVLLEFDVWRAIVNESKLKSLKATKTRPVWITVACEIDNTIFAKINKDPLLQQKLTNPATTAYNKMLQSLIKKAKELDVLCLTKDDVTSKEKGQGIQQFKKDIQEAMKKLQKAAITGMNKAWDNYVKTKAEYKKYKIKAAVAIGLELGSITVGVVGSIGSAGFGLIVGIYGIVKAVAALATQVYKLAIDADKARKKVTKELEKLKKSYNKNKKGKTTSQLKQAAKGFLNFLFGTNVTTTISTAKSNNDLYFNKLQGVDVNSHKVSKSLQQCITDIGKLSQEIKSVKSTRLRKALTQLELMVDRKIKQTIEMQGKVQEGLVWQKNTADILNFLHKEQSSKWVDCFEKGLVLIDLSLTASATNWKDMAGVLSTTATVLKEVDSRLLEKI